MGENLDGDGRRGTGGVGGVERGELVLQAAHGGGGVSPLQEVGDTRTVLAGTPSQAEPGGTVAKGGGGCT